MSDFILNPGDQFDVLSLWQPWASAIAMGAKQYETRHWFLKSPPQYLAIHAALRWTGSERQNWGYFMRRFPELRWPSPMPFGAMLCICELGKAHRSEEIRDQLSPQELAFGDYADNRFAWELKVVHVFKKPIPARGAQGLWKWTYSGAV